MNSIVQEYFPVFQMYQGIRGQLMDVLSDEDLSFSPGGENPSLGRLCLEIGETERAYIDSFKTFKLDFGWRQPDQTIADSVEQLKTWFDELDKDLKSAVESLSEEDVQNKMIYRGENFLLPPRIQLSVYQEALLIFYGKAMVYLKAMGKPRPEQMEGWIA
ncbi:MAG: DinB family protein [Ardenticatenaceae bacterium]|nr:DinB family protein [Ardenticatenaceae bacterium]